MIGWHDHGLGWVGWPLMTLAMAGFWGLVLLGVVSLFRTGGTPARDKTHLGPPPASPPPGSSAPGTAG